MLLLAKKQQQQLSALVRLSSVVYGGNKPGVLG